jgi:hypothetical protein
MNGRAWSRDLVETRTSTGQPVENLHLLSCLHIRCTSSSRHTCRRPKAKDVRNGHWPIAVLEDGEQHDAERRAA